MNHINTNDILQTIKMINQEKLDIRTVTMGISLFDTIDDDPKKSREKIYDKITKNAEKLVEMSEKVSRRYSIPIVNKRIAVTPISMIAANSFEDTYIEYARTLDKAAKTVGVDFIGGFSSLCQKAMTDSDRVLIDSLPEALANTDIVCSSINVGSTKSGINMDAVKKMGEVIKETARLTADKDSIGCAKLVVFCNAVEDNPFMAGAFHGVSEAETSISVGISGPGAVKKALEKVRGERIDVVSEEIKKISFKMTRMGELVGKEVAKLLGFPFNIVDLSLAPTPDIGDSVGRIIEEIGIEHTGGHGTTAVLALLNDSVKKGGIMASSHVGGLSGAFIPVSEDEGMIECATNGYLSFDKLEAMTCVCSVGLDMIAIPGDTPASTISAIIADEAAIGMINSKTTAVRIIPVEGKKCGDEAVFGNLLGKAPIIDIGNTRADDFINRGGYIPAPIHSFKN